MLVVISQLFNAKICFSVLMIFPLTEYPFDEQGNSIVPAKVHPTSAEERSQQKPKDVGLEFRHSHASLLRWERSSFPLPQSGVARLNRCERQHRPQRAFCTDGESQQCLIVWV
jgi:hypothetical protein